ncbi:diphosphomevalonate decarboxylase [Clostridium intestinale]|uniref:diphosphomevalonate decarboxylase n=1 Tax=Clostridium intestinale DSM 6191 TaxID=1121320 RepID=A0A1M5YWW3_9CLOT|nr:diphosphomevalonate decarboxylase [Clostridium intestinale]SHI16043.1 diphosphomevalonate decarboxylase [Clostridium intestinale DSM 6191]
MKAKAKANTNIALIKYWGKRDNELILPMNSSISITLDGFYTITSVEFNENLKNDVFILNNKETEEKDQKKISKFLDVVRELSGTKLYAEVNSENKVPTAAGFASSASGFAALACASSKAAGLNLSERELSMLARRGSGSACRSIFGGYVKWEKGEKLDGTDSHGVRLLSEKDWDISILSVMVASGKKKVSSREGMKRTVETSPFYSGWLDTVEKDIKIAEEAIRLKDFYSLGNIAEENALKIHATMLGAKPPVLYWEHGTLEVMGHIQNLRESGIPAFFTIDAGANVKVLCLKENENMVYESLLKLSSVMKVLVCHPGSGVTYLE